MCSLGIKTKQIKVKKLKIKERQKEDPKEMMMMREKVMEGGWVGLGWREQ